MPDTISYKERTYTEAEALALMQAMDDQHVEPMLRKFNGDSHWGAWVGFSYADSLTPWASLCAAVRAAGLEDAT